MINQLFRVVVPKSGKLDILGLITDQMDEEECVRELESYYGFACRVATITFTPPQDDSLTPPTTKRG